MNRKLMLFAAGLLPIAFLPAQHPNITSAYEHYRQSAIQMNDLAGHIDSPQDADRLVSMVANEFSGLPPKWTTRSLRNRIAQAEYAAAVDPRALIPEQRIADAWNDYLEKIGAPQESFVTPAELHTLRDSLYVGSQMFWVRSVQNMWSMPNIYALGPDGKVADGCRALEAIRILWDFGDQPDNLRGIREMTKKGVMLSDTIKNPAKPPQPGKERSYVTAELRVLRNPVEDAERQYLRDHGPFALDRAIQRLIEDLFPQ